MAKPRYPGCRERDARLAALERRVAELEARLGQNAANSSVPPSANPPAAPQPVVKEPTGRTRGGQPGPAPHQRLRLPPERVREVVHSLPRACRDCGHDLPAAAGPRDPKPTWHQVAALPDITAQLTEHQGHTRTCPRGGVRTHAVLPADVRAYMLGPRLSDPLQSGFCFFPHPTPAVPWVTLAWHCLRAVGRRAERTTGLTR